MISSAYLLPLTPLITACAALTSGDNDRYLLLVLVQSMPVHSDHSSIAPALPCQDQSSIRV